jgi:hypothetical protein
MRAKGFIKLHRKIRDTKLYKDSYTMHLWLELLSRVNHKANSWEFGGRLCSVKAGECLVSLYSLSDSTGIKVSRIRCILKKLKTAQMITSKSTPYGTYIELVSWAKYQEDNKKCIAKPNKVAYNKNEITKGLYKPLTKINKLI